MTREERNHLVTLDDHALLSRCDMTVARGSGRGGQKRNRTESAVRLALPELGVSVTCDASRSQQTNRKLALRKLRLEIALACRCAPADAYDGAWCPGKKSQDYPLWTAWVLDVLEACAFRVSDAASHCGVSTGRLVRDLASDPALWQTVNAGRQRHGHSTLRT